MPHYKLRTLLILLAVLPPLLAVGWWNWPTVRDALWPPPPPPPQTAKSIPFSGFDPLGGPDVIVAEAGTSFLIEKAGDTDPLAEVPSKTTP
jgi:hypothetical protein